MAPSFLPERQYQPRSIAEGEDNDDNGASDSHIVLRGGFRQSFISSNAVMDKKILEVDVGVFEPLG